MLNRIYSVITVIMLFIIMMVPVSCRTEGKRTIDPYVPYGWHDDNTFRVLSEGSPLPDDTNLVKKKMHARNMALKKARIKLIELFIPAGGDAGIRVDEFDPGGNPEADSKMSIIMNGRIVQENYDEYFNCEMIYEISSPGLKKKLTDETGK